MDLSTVKWSRVIATRIGHAALRKLDETFLFVSNLHDGVDEYRFPSIEKVSKFVHPICDNMPLQVVCTTDGRFVICGGDKGFSRVFNRNTGQLVQVLQHSGIVISSKMFNGR